MPTWSSNFPDRPFRLELRVNLSSQNTGANTSTLSWSVWIIKNSFSPSFSNNTSTFSRAIAGQTGSGSFTYDFTSNDSLQLASGTRTVTHNASGNYTAYSSASANVQIMGYTFVDGSFSLPNIPPPAPPSSPPSAPTSPIVDQISATGFRYRFTPGDPNGATVTSNQVQRSLSSTFASGNTTVTSSGTTTFSGLSHGTWYVRSRSENSEGFGPWSATRSAVLLLPAPTLTSWEQNDSGGLVAQWSPPSVTTGLTGYRLQVAENAAFTSSVTTYNVGDVTTATATGLSGGREYFARVTALTAAGTQTYSSSLDNTLVLDAGDLDGWRQAGTPPTNAQYFTAEGVRRGSRLGRQALWIESNATGAVSLSAGQVGMERDFELEEGRSYIFRASITRTNATPQATTYRLEVGSNIGGTATLGDAITTVPLPEVEFVAGAGTTTVRVMLGAAVSASSGQVLERVAIVGIALLELPSDFPQRLRSTVYESTLANHFDLACNSVGATWHVDRFGVTQFLLPGSTRPVRAVFSDQRTADVQEYQAVVGGYDTRSMVNRLNVTNQGIGEDNLANDETLVVSNVQSESRWGTREESLNVNLYGEAPYETALQDRLQQILAANDEPELLLTAVRWNAQENLALAKVLEIGDRVTVVFNTVSQDSQVVSIDHTLTPTRWMVQLNLVPL